jgi:hypothetical protein
MKNINIVPILFLCSFLFIFSLNSFKTKPRQGCTPGFIKSWTISVNAQRTSLRGALPGYEQCVRSFQNNNLREEFITDAYSVLGAYYLSIKDINTARLYRSLVAQENRRQ